MRIKSVLVFAIVILFIVGFWSCESALADLTQLQDSVYRTGSGTNSLYWYLNMGGLVNQTWSQQVSYAANLRVNIEGIQNNWHIASKQELDQLLVWGTSPQNTLVANAIGVIRGDPGMPEYATHARYNETWTAGQTNHYNTNLWQSGGNWTASPTGMYLDYDSVAACGAWIVTTSAPYIRAEADGSYVINVGESLLLDSSNSYSNCGIDELRWRIDGHDVGSTVSYTTLVNNLSLSLGMHNVELRAGGGGVYSYDYSTIQIVPEPATLFLLCLGAVMLRRMRS